MNSSLSNPYYFKVLYSGLRNYAFFFSGNYALFLANFAPKTLNYANCTMFQLIIHFASERGFATKIHYIKAGGFFLFQAEIGYNYFF